VEKNAKRNCSDSIRVIELPSEKYKGIQCAHAYVKEFSYKKEKYWCEAYPKLRFVLNWDNLATTECKKALALNPKSLLTCIPPDVFQKVPTYPIVRAGKDDHKFPTVEKAFFTTNNPGRPYMTPLVCPSFIFAPMSCIEEVSPSKNLSFCDHAESFVRTLRLYTHGWIPFTPSCIIVQRRRNSPIDLDDSDEVISPAFAKTAEKRKKMYDSINLILFSVKEDLCAVCDKPRKKHTTKQTLNHPFECTLERKNIDLLGKEKSIKQFKEYSGCWIKNKINISAAVGITGEKLNTDERSVKGIDNDFLGHSIFR
jgi:hypothetical protein